MIAALGLSPWVFAQLAAIAAVAGLVRGFTGFALSAFALSLAVLILPPVKLIPVMWWLEIGASVLMVRDGWRQADLKVALTLVIGSAFGLVLGLGLTTRLDPAVSRQLALVVLVGLAALQLAKVRLTGLANTPGLIVTGVVAGCVTGIAGIGGMVIALYVLAREAPPHVMRATLVIYLFGGSATSLATHLAYGTMTQEAVLLGLALLPACLLGVMLGQRLFTPRLQPYYRPVCLTLLVTLGVVSLLRSVM